MSEDDRIDQLSEQELEELTSPDDNLDNDDVEVSEHHVNMVAVICAATAGLLAIGAAVTIGMHLHNRCKATQQSRFAHEIDTIKTHAGDMREHVDDLRGHVKSFAEQVNPIEIAKNPNVRDAVGTMTRTLRDIPGDMMHVAGSVKGAIID